MSYIPPNEVTSPRRHFTLVGVIDDGKTDDNPTGEDAVSLAVGRWKNDAGTEEAVLGMRWNGNSVNRIGSPQSRGLPTWFIVPPHLRRVILDNMSLGEGKQELLQEVFGDEYHAGPDGTGWICDKCGQAIRCARDGVVEWVDSDKSSTWEGDRISVVHHYTASPLTEKTGRDGCYIPREEQRRTRSTTSWLHLDRLLGPDGLMTLLEMISDGSVPLEEILAIIQRLHLPRYERARKYVTSAIADGLFEPNRRPGFYSQDDLSLVLENYPKEDS